MGLGKRVPHPSVFRKIAIGSWKTAADPSVYGLVEVDATNALQKIEKLRIETGIRITMTHYVGHVVAQVLAKRPEMNSLLRLGQIYRRSSVDLFFQTHVPKESFENSELSGVTVRGAENLSLVEIAQALENKVTRLRKHNEGELNRSVKVLSYVPSPLMRWMLNLTSFLNYDLGLPMNWIGMPKDPFGSVFITNVGSLGIDCAWAPLVPFTRVPLLITVGQVRERPWVVNGEVVARPVLRLGVTFDHRLMDGSHAAEMLKIFEEGFAAVQISSS